MPINNDVQMGKDVKIFHMDLVNLYGCVIGDETRIGTFVEIQVGVAIGRRCKIQSHTFICEGVTIEDEVFIGHGVMFTNDPYPRATNSNGSLQAKEDWKCLPTHVGQGVSIGSNATILSNIRIGKNALIGAGAVVTKSVPDYAIMAGNPARVIGWTNDIKGPKA